MCLLITRTPLVQPCNSQDRSLIAVMILFGTVFSTGIACEQPLPSVTSVLAKLELQIRYSSNPSLKILNTIWARICNIPITVKSMPMTAGMTIAPSTSRCPDSRRRHQINIHSNWSVSCYSLLIMVILLVLRVARVRQVIIKNHSGTRESDSKDNNGSDKKKTESKRETKTHEDKIIAIEKEGAPRFIRQR